MTIVQLLTCCSLQEHKWAHSVNCLQACQKCCFRSLGRNLCAASVTACLKPLNCVATVSAPPVTATLFRTACPVVLSVQHTGWYVIFRSAINPFQSLRRHVQELNRKKNMSQSLTYAVASCDVYGVPLAVLIPKRSLEFWQVFLTEHVRRQ